VAISRILLVKCSQHEGLLSSFSFPLGIMYLASTLRRASDRYDIKIYDLRMTGQDYSDLGATVTGFKPDLVGVSAITMEAPSLEQAVKTVRKTGFEGPIVVGGPHATAYPDETLSNQDIDYLVLGEGEETFKDLINALDTGSDRAKVPGVAFRKDGITMYSAQRPPIQDLDAIPHPAWDLISFDGYTKFRSMSTIRRNRYMNLFTSRACPFNCIYCHSVFGKKFRARSPENVLDEARQLVDKYRVRHLEIVDDIFNCNLERSKKILDLLHAEGLSIDISFPNGLRCDRLDREFLEKLSRFPFALICVSIETASPRIQKLIKKNLNLSRVSEVINWCSDLRIYSRGYFMLGFPTETREELKATIDFAVKSRLHTAYFFVVVPFRGTKLYEMAFDVIKQRGYDYSDHDYIRSPMNVSEIPDKDLFGAQRWAYLRMFTRPSRIFRILRDNPDYGLFWDGLKSYPALMMAAGKGFRPGKPHAYAKARGKALDLMSGSIKDSKDRI
jgi:anaerobic magnesium-protoporphyrin IX monomethyl ester cyclase